MTDKATQEYYRDYFKDLGYGEALVRKIPHRIKAAINAKQKLGDVDGKFAATAASPTVTGGAVIEGIYRTEGARPRSFVIAAHLDAKGSITKIDAIGV